MPSSTGQVRLLRHQQACLWQNFLLKRKALDASVPLRASDLRCVDFGLAVFLRPGEQLKELLGSPFYIAPELLQV